MSDAKKRWRALWRGKWGILLSVLAVLLVLAICLGLAVLLQAAVVYPDLTPEGLYTPSD